MAAHVEDLVEYVGGKLRKQDNEANRLARFRDDEKGGILIFSLFLLIMMLMISGMAVDLMRAETHRARLQSTLDRAILAGASLDQSLDSEAVVRDYFEKAGLEDYLNTVTVVDGDNSRAVTATAKMSVNSYFMKMMGINTLSAPASGKAEESLSNIEISLIVDISGSMGWNSSASGNPKIVDLRNAAQDFVYEMQCNPDDSDPTSTCTVEDNTVSINLVPYAEQVLVGESLIQEFNVSMEHTDSSCADFAEADFSSASISLTNTLDRAGRIDNRTNYRSSRSWSNAASDSRRTCRTNSYREIVPLSNDYSDLQTQIGQLQAGGYTSIDMGMKWGTALLDPAFRPVVANSLTVGASPVVNSAFDDRPYDYSARSMKKVVVLMTDGENTTQYVLKDAFKSGASPVYVNSDDGRVSAYRASTNQYWYPHNDSWNDEPYGDGQDWVCTGPWYNPSCGWEDQPGNAVQITYQQFWEDYNVDYYEEEFWFLPDPTDFYRYADKNTRLNSICTAAKAQGIEVFTIGFETSTASNAVMQNCASSDSHHFDVDGIDLDDAFSSIAREIHSLRLTL